MTPQVMTICGGPVGLNLPVAVCLLQDKAITS